MTVKILVCEEVNEKTAISFGVWSTVLSSLLSSPIYTSNYVAMLFYLW